MIITTDVFQAFLDCETKAYLRNAGMHASHEFTQWQNHRQKRYEVDSVAKLRATIRNEEFCYGTPLLEALSTQSIVFLFDCLVHTPQVEARLHAVEHLAPNLQIPHAHLIPIRFIPSEKITQKDKMILAFDGIALSHVTGDATPFGRIVHGQDRRSIRVELPNLFVTTRAALVRCEILLAAPVAPPLVLNQHCGECEFRKRCRKIAIEKDDLSLLSGINEAERQKLNEKGIFTVTQLSYTFRVRRQAKGHAVRPMKNNPALRALAIRTTKPHLCGTPNVRISGHPVYLDVEGDPDRDLYYLIGVRTNQGDAILEWSFWADTQADEQHIWFCFLRFLASIENPQILHFGSYESVFLRRMQDRYGELAESEIPATRLIESAVNVLSVIYGQVYFPTYTNGLKDIAHYLKFSWTDENASGLMSLVWRGTWEQDSNPELRQKLITYNLEDCAALELLTNVLVRICQEQPSAELSPDLCVVNTRSMQPESLYRFGKSELSSPDLQFINECAYWDYQREHVYVRSSPLLRRLAQSEEKKPVEKFRIDRRVTCEFPPPALCPKCGSADVVMNSYRTKIIWDLKFSNAGVKRWVVEYRFPYHKCQSCRRFFVSRELPWTRHKYGLQLLAYIVYAFTELLLSLKSVRDNINKLFGFNMHPCIMRQQKQRACQLFQPTYDTLLKKITNGRLIHADETKITIDGTNNYVWVLANMEEIVYMYAETREGETIHELLKNFRGILVSDFYAVYDSLDCLQQKCLIHLIRDLNDDLAKHPFNEELKTLLDRFAALLKPMVETVDRFGLKERHLRKHVAAVDLFFNALQESQYQTEIALKAKQRFEKNRNKLFTFLSHDGVPWNNNNAETAIKRFAALRERIEGSSSSTGMKEYLMLLSIRETCRYKGISFLDFLRSGEKDIDEFIRQGCRVQPTPFSIR